MGSLMGVYEIKCIPTGERYIGGSVDVKRRFQGHKAELRRGKHRNKYLQAAWDKHGEEAFEFNITEQVADKRFLLDTEQSHLDTTRNLFNIAMDARAPGKGLKRSAEMKAKISKALTGKRKTAATRGRMSKAKAGKTNVGFATPQEYQETAERLKEYRERLYEVANEVFEKIEAKRVRPKKAIAEDCGAADGC